MAWEWSHTQEAYANACENLGTFTDEQIAVIWAEWKAYCKASAGEFNRFAYNWAIQKARKLIRQGMREAVESDIWERMSEFATCDNGGFLAWACPFGCGCHKVSFDAKQDEEPDDGFMDEPFDDDEPGDDIDNQAEQLEFAEYQDD